MTDWDEPASNTNAPPLPRGAKLVTEKKNKGGRPKGRANPNINWKLAEQLYVEGELVGEDENTQRLYSSMAQIAERAGTSKNNLEQRARRYKWREKREKFQLAKGIPPTYQPNTFGKDGIPISAKPLRRDAASILLAYIDLFAEAVQKRTIRYDNVGDLDKAVRLLAFVRGQHESLKATHVTISLDAMQRRHGELRRQVHAHVDDDVAGVLGMAPALDVPYTLEGDEPGGDDALPAGWDDEGLEG